MPTNPTTVRRIRLGVGEWYGHVLSGLSPAKRKEFADLQVAPAASRPMMYCPFLSTVDLRSPCNKPGGVCSMRNYEYDEDTGTAFVASGDIGSLRPVCPNRFQEDSLARSWVGETLLGTDSPASISEVGFLTAIGKDGQPTNADVGRIDLVLFREDSVPLDWCAVEMQAVYITGPSIQADFRTLRRHAGEGLPFPPVNHRLDYRSSGPKRLMPQLQIKVPTLRRWGKKMAVIVDRGFYDALGPMEVVSSVSNSDIGWFVLDIVEDDAGDRAHLTRSTVHYTTLERAVEGLTAGIPVSREEFERRVLDKYGRVSVHKP